jgi:hypothetical protein
MICGNFQNLFHEEENTFLTLEFIIVVAANQVCQAFHGLVFELFLFKPFLSEPTLIPRNFFTP